ncbi:flagellar type III secretion system protein FliQ [Pseudoalteromonas sp. MMG013]|jgi:flagellar biosynthetic protein FliQ|uniref:flagellar biosynthetic protein FliQ n=1 Tax=unclassified Pseudoalteromonas TaxID=194690 RepID=UPI001B372430|nr:MULTISPECIES: flagellar biosynthetic protein FliQ [unclassified Pseudoalteromonas]MBQ4862950.1 flagellar type III secretion system protein FliQ [Pseudoalteromonas sp. MMG013]
MDTDVVITHLGGMFQIALKVAMPLLISTLIVGLMISIIQVVTQVQEMTLTFVPKILVSIAVLAVAGPWMLGILVEFSIHTISSIRNF